MIQHLLLIALAGCVLVEATSLAPRYKREETGNDDLDFLARRAKQSMQRGENRFKGLVNTTKKSFNEVGNAAFDVIDQGVDSSADVLEAGIRGTSQMTKAGLHVAQEGVRAAGKVGQSTVRGATLIVSETGELVAEGIHGGTDIFTTLEDAAANTTADALKLGQRGIGSGSRVINKGIYTASAVTHSVMNTTGELLEDGEIISDNMLTAGLNLTENVLHTAEGAVKGAARGLTSITSQTKPTYGPGPKTKPQVPPSNAANQHQNPQSGHSGSGASHHTSLGYKRPTPGSASNPANGANAAQGGHSSPSNPPPGSEYHGSSSSSHHSSKEITTTESDLDFDFDFDNNGI